MKRSSDTQALILSSGDVIPEFAAWVLKSLRASVRCQRNKFKKKELPRLWCSAAREAKTSPMRSQRKVTSVVPGFIIAGNRDELKTYFVMSK